MTTEGPVHYFIHLDRRSKLSKNSLIFLLLRHTVFSLHFHTSIIEIPLIVNVHV